MERLPQYWAVRNDGSVDYKNSVIRYIIDHDDRYRNYFVADDGWWGKYHIGYFANITNEAMKTLKKVTPLPLHLFKQLVANESNSRPFTTRKKASKENIIGYTLKAGVDNLAALRALGITPNEHNQHRMPSLPLTFDIGTSLHQSAINSGMLDLLFDAVYKQPATTVIVRHKTGHLIASIDNHIVTIDGRQFTKDEVQRILAPVNVKGVNFVPTSFTTGCSYQYVNISREDIEQVFNQL